VLLQVLDAELPMGTIRYSSKIVSIDEHDGSKIIHLADGSTLRAKVRNSPRVSVTLKEVSSTCHL
jgi:hypothetical protein